MGSGCTLGFRRLAAMARPQRRRHISRRGLLEQWPEDGPPLEWKATEIGVGMAAVSVASGRTYTSGDQDDRAWLFALDEDSGSLIWTIRRIVAAQ